MSRRVGWRGALQTVCAVVVVAGALEESALGQGQDLDSLAPACTTITASPDIPAEFAISATGGVTRADHGSRYVHLAVQLLQDVPRVGDKKPVHVRLFSEQTSQPHTVRLECEGDMPLRDYVQIPGASAVYGHLVPVDAWRIEVYAHGDPQPPGDTPVVATSLAASIAQINGRNVKGNTLVDESGVRALADQSVQQAARASLAVQCGAPPTQQTGAPPTKLVGAEARLRCASEAADAAVQASAASTAIDGSPVYPAAVERLSKAKERLHNARKGLTGSNPKATADENADAKLAANVTLDAAESAFRAANEEVEAVKSERELANDARSRAEADASKAASNYEQAISPQDQPPFVHDNACYSLVGTFDLPSTRASVTIPLRFGSRSNGTGTPVVDGPFMVTAWATDVRSNKVPTFTWQIMSGTDPSFSTVLAELLAFVDQGKAVVPSGQASMVPPGQENSPGLWTRTSSTTTPPKDIHLCSATENPLAKFTSYAQGSNRVPGGLVASRTYIVSASIGPLDPPKPQTWTVSKPSVGTTTDIYTISGPPLAVASGASSAPGTPPSNPNSVQASFNSRSGAGFRLLVTSTYDVDVLHGRFPAYQWRPTNATNEAQGIYALDNVPQPLAPWTFSVLVAVVSPEGKSGRFGFGLGPDLLWGTGTTGFLQGFTGDFLYTLPHIALNSIADRIYLVAGFGGRLVNVPVGDYPGELVAVPRTNGNAPAPTGPVTRNVLDPVLSFGLGFNLSLIPQAVSSLTSSKSGGSQ